MSADRFMMIVAAAVGAVLVGGLLMVSCSRYQECREHGFSAGYCMGR